MVNFDDGLGPRVFADGRVNVRRQGYESVKFPKDGFVRPNPHPVLSPQWLTWRQGALRALSEQSYEAKRNDIARQQLKRETGDSR